MRDFDQVIKHSSLWCVEESEVIICTRCAGLGHQKINNAPDPYDREPDFTYKICENCDGDGRLVKTRRYVELSTSTETKYTPYPKFSGDPFAVSKDRYSIIKDHRDPRLEEKYPKLAACTYDVYNKLVEDYRLLDLLDKEENER